MSELTDDIEMGLNRDKSLDEYTLDNDTFGLKNSSNSTGGSNSELEMVIHSFTHDTQVNMGVDISPFFRQMLHLTHFPEFC